MTIFFFYKNNRKKRLQILKGVNIKNKQSNINTISFKTGANIVNIFNN